MTLRPYFQLMRFHKPIGILLLLWPTLWALWFARQGQPDWRIVSIFVLGVILMRAAGCIINDVADRHIDKHVARTADRPLTTGKISVRAAMSLFCLLMLAAFLLVLLLNKLTIQLAFAAAFFAIIYPFLKRITHLPQVGLGMAFAWSVPMAFAAETAHVPWSAWELFLAAMIWPVMYDTIYALTDRADDLKIGVKSTAILFGRYDYLAIGCLQILFILLMAHVGRLFHMRHVYFGGLCVAIGLFGYQHYLLRKRHYFKAFLNNQWVGMIIFLGILL